MQGWSEQLMRVGVVLRLIALAAVLTISMGYDGDASAFHRAAYAMFATGCGLLLLGWGAKTVVEGRYDPQRRLWELVGLISGGLAVLVSVGQLAPGLVNLLGETGKTVDELVRALLWLVATFALLRARRIARAGRMLGILLVMANLALLTMAALDQVAGWQPGWFWEARAALLVCEAVAWIAIVYEWSRARQHRLPRARAAEPARWRKWRWLPGSAVVAAGFVAVGLLVGARGLGVTAPEPEPEPQQIWVAPSASSAPTSRLLFLRVDFDDDVCPERHRRASAPWKLGCRLWR